MKSPLLTAVTVLLLAFATTALAGDLTSAERAALQSDAGTELASMRAGDAESAPIVAVVERSALGAATAAAPELEELRAGEVTDEDILTGIGVAVGVIVLAIIIF